MVTLVDMKINGEYEKIEARAPLVTDDSGSGISIGWRWLDTVTGWSYVCDDNAVGAAVWTRTQVQYDNKFALISDGVWNSTLEYLGNPFPVYRPCPYDGTIYTKWTEYEWADFLRYVKVYSEWTFDTATKTITITADSTLVGNLDEFQIGDTILVTGSYRNHGRYTIAALNTVTNVITTVEDLAADEVSCATIAMSSIPDAVTQIVGRMLYFDIFERGGSGGIKSETIGTYSYTGHNDSILVGVNRYPTTVAGDLKLYIGGFIGGSSVYVP